jgi:dephospho-CoA kinase
MSNRPLQIGITGGIGAGKSIICKIFNTLGVPVYSADDRAKWLMNNDNKLKSDIISEFSDKAYKSGNLDRQYLAKNAFHDSEKLELLNSLVHPAVAIDYKDWIAGHKGDAYVIKEAALLFEMGSHQYMDFTLVVTAPKSVRIDRIKSRDPQRSEAQIMAIIDKQMDRETSVKMADYVVANDSATPVLPRVLDLHQVFLSKSNR